MFGADDEAAQGVGEERGPGVLALAAPRGMRGAFGGVAVEGDEAAVGNGDAVSVTPEIGENLGRSAERLLGIDDPVDVPHGGEMSSEGRGFGEMRQIAEEAQGAGVEGSLQAFEKQASEEPGERLREG